MGRGEGGGGVGMVVSRARVRPLTRWDRRPRKMRKYPFSPLHTAWHGAARPRANAP